MVQHTKVHLTCT